MTTEMVKITFQTNAILRYIARKHDLCGKVLVLDMLRVLWRRRIIIRELNIAQTEEERARVDMLADQSMDFRYFDNTTSLKW